MGKITLTFNELKELIKLGFLKPRDDGEHKYSRKQITKAHKKKLAYERKTKGEKLYRSRGGARISRGGSFAPVPAPVFTNSSNLATESQSIANRAAEMKLKQLQNNIDGNVEEPGDVPKTRFDIGAVQGLLLKQKEEYEGVLSNRLTEADETFNKRLADADEAFNARLAEAESKTANISNTLNQGMSMYNNDKREWKSFQQKMTGDDYGNLVGNTNPEDNMHSMDSTGTSERFAQSVAPSPQMDRPMGSTSMLNRLTIEAPSPAVGYTFNVDEHQGDDNFATVDTQDESSFEPINESYGPVDVIPPESPDVSLVEEDHPNVTVRKSKSKPKTIPDEAVDDEPFIPLKVKKIAKKVAKEATEEVAVEAPIKKRGRPVGTVSYHQTLQSKITNFNKEMKGSQVFNKKTGEYEPWVPLKPGGKKTPVLEGYIKQIDAMGEKTGYFQADH